MKIPTQVCKKCGVEKMLLEFRICTYNGRGIEPTCRDCRKSAKKPTEIERLRKTRPEIGGETWWKKKG